MHSHSTLLGGGGVVIGPSSRPFDISLLIGIAGVSNGVLSLTLTTCACICALQLMSIWS